MKEEIDKVNSIKVKNFCFAKDDIKGRNTSHKVREITCKTYT
jgi:hypothetical protein